MDDFPLPGAAWVDAQESFESNLAPSWSAETNKVLPKVPHGALRQVFQNMPMEKPRAQPSGRHSHPESAADRSAGLRHMLYVTHCMGRSPYVTQMSKSVQRKGYKGSRVPFWDRDLTADFQLDPLPNNPVIIQVDVDQYVNMNRTLVNSFHPHLLYTFQPTAVAESTGEYVFTWAEGDGEGDRVKYSVNGGAVYEHPVWNYTGADVITAQEVHWFSVRRSVYNVDVKHTDAHHAVVLLTPSVTYTAAGMGWLKPLRDKLPWPLDRAISLLEPAPLQGRSLERYQVIGNAPAHEPGEVQFMKLVRQTRAGREVSIAPVGTYAAVTVPETFYETCRASVRSNKKGRITAARVLKLARDTGLELPEDAACRLVEYFRAMPYCGGTVVTAGLTTTPVYTWNPTVDQVVEMDCPMVELVAPFIEGAAVPARSGGNNACALTRRVAWLRNTNPAMTRKDYDDISAYVDLIAKVLVPGWSNGRRLQPIDSEQARAYQKRATQQVLWDQGETEGKPNAEYQPALKGFMKVEAGAILEGSKLPNPRLITTFPGAEKVNYASYAYPIMAALKNWDCYAFGVHPGILTERVAEIARTSATILLTDLSRQDGNTKMKCRLFEHLLLIAIFSEEHHPDLLEAFSQGWDRTTVMREPGNGEVCGPVAVETGTTRSSGILTTSAFNSLESGLCAFLGLVDGGLSHREAFEHLNRKGIFGGDDGLVGDYEGDFPAACERLGHRAKAVVAQPGGRPVEFLARIYSPNVWTGSPDNVADIKRQFQKVHLSTRVPIQQIPARFTQKMIALHLTDANTPVLGVLACAYLTWASRHHPTLVDGAQNSGLPGTSWFARLLSEAGAVSSDDFNNWNEEGWAEAIWREQMPTLDFDGFVEWCERASQDNSGDFAVWRDHPLFMEARQTLVGDEEPTDHLAIEVDGETDLVPIADPPPEPGHTYYDYCDKYQLKLKKGGKTGGGCGSGTCAMRHERRPKYCNSYMKTGECERGDNCKYVHELVLCRAAIRTGCRAGDECRKYHPTSGIDKPE